MKKMIGLIMFLLAIVMSLGCYRIAGLNKEIEVLKQKIASEQALESTEKIERLENNPVDTTTAWKIDEARKWLLNPEEKNFDEMAELLKDLMTRDELFKWYVDCNVLGDYMKYISSSGVRKYKASYIRKTLNSAQEDWWLKELYKSPENSDVHSVQFIVTADVEIPRELMASQIEFENFLTIMEGVFPRK